MDHQRTIEKEINLSGTGIHTGSKVSVKIKPGEPDTGIIFIRTDHPKQKPIKADVANVLELERRPRRTSVGTEDIEIHTIEHLLASLSGLGIDNCVIEIHGEELPGLDGSATPLVEALKKAGIKDQEPQKKYFVVKEPIYIEKDGSSIVAIPSEDFKISYAMFYDHPLLRSQFKSVTINTENFEKEIAPSRTFCLKHEAKNLKDMGLGKGATYENTLVVGDEGVVENKLRFDDEFVRHKILDLIGDLYLLGCRIKGHIIAVKSGHSLNVEMVRRMKAIKSRVGEASIAAPSKEAVGSLPWNVEDIKKILPHRPPFLFVDQITELGETRIVGTRFISPDEYFFPGHFPGKPIMPGVLILEAMAQVAGILMLHKVENREKIAFFVAIDNVKFRKTVLPGDLLRMEISVIKLKTKIGQVHANGYVGDQLVAEADLMFALVDR